MNQNIAFNLSTINSYGQTESHSNVSKEQEAKGTSMEQTAVQSMQYQSKSNPKVKVTLEFTGELDNTAMETEITNVLTEKYLEKILQGSMQSGVQALLSSPLKRNGGKNK